MAEQEKYSIEESAEGRQVNCRLYDFRPLQVTLQIFIFEFLFPISNPSLSFIDAGLREIEP